MEAGSPERPSHWQQRGEVDTLNRSIRNASVLYSGFILLSLSSAYCLFSALTATAFSSVLPLLRTTVWQLSILMAEPRSESLSHAFAREWDTRPCADIRPLPIR